MWKGMMVLLGIIILQILLFKSCYFEEPIGLLSLWILFSSIVKWSNCATSSFVDGFAVISLFSYYYYFYWLYWLSKYPAVSFWCWIKLFLGTELSNADISKSLNASQTWMCMGLVWTLTSLQVIIHAALLPRTQITAIQ